MRILVLVARRVPPVPSPILVEAARRLTERGHVVDFALPEEMVAAPTRLADGHDLVVLKSHTELALSLAAVLHDAEVPMLNPFPACAAIQDKIVAVARMAAFGVPVPRSWTTGDMTRLSGLGHRWPLVVKPHRGHRGAGVRIVGDQAELAGLDAPTTPVIVQEHVPGPGHDLKVYVVGEQVYAVRKRFAADSFTRPGDPVPVSAQVREIALRCGEAFGVSLYGLDLIESPDGPVVVDLNYFPGYKGVPDVAPRIAAHIDDWSRGRVPLGLPPLPMARELVGSKA